ncbi:MAG: hypothetical protein JO246_01175 [Frankiaceae bacterium]|nr:hypothetical protein [Frankiaceae bacterium]MBV9870851.1 hypothetical protein [Frankiaceae bacterium]
MSSKTADGDFEKALAVADSLSSDTVEAAGTVSEGLEYIERARGHLYSFHQLMGRADMLLGRGADQLRSAGHENYADELRKNIVGRDVLPDRWTFQIVEEFDSGYWSVVRDFVGRLTEDVFEGQRHVAEAQMKRDQHTR